MTSLVAAAIPVGSSVSLADRYEVEVGRVHLTGIQALARLPIDQSRRDRAAGRNVGTYISGYEGSPLAGYDLELIRQTALLDEHEIVFEPGLNEEAAAMAVQGTQLIGELDARVEGVTGFWYGKAPGLDRATDALRHANLMGSHPLGGAVVLVGDDPAAKSSSVPCASERALADLGMPTFYPADPGEILELGRHAVELSRASGLWTAMKIVTAVADGSASVDLLASHDPVTAPAGWGRHVPTAKLLQPTLGPLERDFMTTRTRIVMDYIRLNRLNAVTAQSSLDRIGVISAGKTYLDVEEALTRLGIGESGSAPVRRLKLDLVWPLDVDQIRAFATGLDEVIVVEEKRSFIEAGVREALYGTALSPVVSGKVAPGGGHLFAPYGELDADSITLGLAQRLDERPEFAGAHRWLEARHRQIDRERLTLPLLQRAPYYCSGCPHNTSTRPNTDSVVGAGIGCHAMVLLMDQDQVGNVIGLTQMGGEGTQWLGMAPFVTPQHFVQNLGDGTFHHSGSLAIRAAVASGRNITYRLLYNSTVAMTGGQDAVGQMDVPSIVRNLLSEGVERIIVTTDAVSKHRRAKFPREVKLWERSRIAEAEQILAGTPGTTVLIHEQECATELRRKRKRGSAPKPTEFVMINERLCEGCGDCGEKSNCLSVHPVETQFGRKTTIHQSSCNNDLTCLSGDCPAFMSISPKTRLSGRPGIAALGSNELPEPASGDAGRPHSIRLMGVGGTGVVTTSQVLATAAVLAGRYVRTLDQTGLAQKGGAVVSDIKIALEPIVGSNKVVEGGCDLYLGYDLLVAADARNVSVLGPASTAVVSTSVVPTGAMVSDKSVTYPSMDAALAPIIGQVGSGEVTTLDARNYVDLLFGAEQFANLFLVGIAFQQGALSLTANVIEEAITLNRVAVESNIQAFRRGRQFVCARRDLDDLVDSLAVGPRSLPHVPSALVGAEPGSALEQLVAVRRTELIAYQNARYAGRYEALVERARVAELATGTSLFSEAVAKYAFKLMAYKDEYEVARLARDAEVLDGVRQQFGDDAAVKWRLHPPTLRAIGMERKISLGRWFTGVFAVLYSLRWLRGTPFDPFGCAPLRREERRLVDEYEFTVQSCAAALDRETLASVVRIAELPDMVRGYEGVKLRAIETYKAERAELLSDLGIQSTRLVRR